MVQCHVYRLATAKLRQTVADLINHNYYFDIGLFYLLSLRSGFRTVLRMICCELVTRQSWFHLSRGLWCVATWDKWNNLHTIPWNRLRRPHHNDATDHDSSHSYEIPAVLLQMYLPIKELKKKPKKGLSFLLLIFASKLDQSSRKKCQIIERILPKSCGKKVLATEHKKRVLAGPCYYPR